MSERQIYNEPANTMSFHEFEQLSEFIKGHCGIKMPVSKKIMLEARLQKRLRVHRISSFRRYCDLLFHSPDGPGELRHMIDAVTTNKTDFFREPLHFSFLTDMALPEFTAAADAEDKRIFTVWSAGCSSGEEPYTLAMVLSEFAARCPGFLFTILATDISTRVLEKARLAVYSEEQATGVPFDMKQKYLRRSKDRCKGLVRIAPELRSLVQFQQLNLMEEHFAFIEGTVDAVFCRNVIIYFERETQYRILSRLCRCLKTGGHLFLGHSETVHGFDLPLVRIASTIYRKAP